MTTDTDNQIAEIEADLELLDGFGGIHNERGTYDGCEITVNGLWVPLENCRDAALVRVVEHCAYLLQELKAAQAEVKRLTGELEAARADADDERDWKENHAVPLIKELRARCTELEADAQFKQEIFDRGKQIVEQTEAALDREKAENGRLREVGAKLRDDLLLRAEMHGSKDEDGTIVVDVSCGVWMEFNDLLRENTDGE